MLLFLIWLSPFRVLSRMSDKSWEHRKTRKPCALFVGHCCPPDSILGATQPEMDTITAFCTLRIDMREELDWDPFSYSEWWFKVDVSVNLTIVRVCQIIITMVAHSVMHTLRMGEELERSSHILSDTDIVHFSSSCMFHTINRWSRVEFFQYNSR